jgi:DNA invertase Pin-like site-specific DNA recombinase
MDIISNAGGATGFSFDDSSNPNSQPPTGRGRVRGDDFGLPERAGLIDLARTYLDAQARLWPELVGTPAVPVSMPATVEPMADDFERRFRQQHAEVFRPHGTPKVWADLGIAYLRFSDEGSNPRSLDQQLNNVLNRARRDGIFIPWQYVCADAAVSGTLSCRRGYAIAKMLVERRAETGAAWFVIDDLSRMSRNTIESLRLGELAADTGVRVIGASDGVDSDGQQSKIILPMMSSFHEVFIDQLKSKVHRGMDDAFLRGENIQPPGVGYRMVPVTHPDGSLMFTHKGTVEKRAEVDPEPAEWIRRGAEMIAHEGKSPMEVARLFNEQKVGGKATWSDNRVRKLYSRERLVGREVFRTTKQVRDRQTGRVRYEKLPKDQWLTRESPHLRILSDDLAMAVRSRLNLAAQAFGRQAKEFRKSVYRADLYPKVLIRPICGGCGTPMILGRSIGKYQSFVCHNAIHGMKGCKNRGYKSARIIDEAVLGAVAAELFSERFVAAVTKDVNAILAAAAKRPFGNTKKLEQDIANRERQIARLTARLDKVGDASGLDAIFDKVAEMDRELKAKREELAEQQRLNCRPPVQQIKEKDVTAVLTQLRDLLHSDVGLAAPALKDLIGDVLIESRVVEGQTRPQMFVRFTIDALPALAAIRRGSDTEADDGVSSLWGYLREELNGTAAFAAGSRVEIEVQLRRQRRTDEL